MQNKKMKQDFVLLSIPAKMLTATGIFEGGGMRMSVEENRLIIEKADAPEDFVCDGDCEHCPLNETDCDGNCEDCPCSEECEDAEV